MSNSKSRESEQALEKAAKEALDRQALEKTAKAEREALGELENYAKKYPELDKIDPAQLHSVFAKFYQARMQRLTQAHTRIAAILKDLERPEFASLVNREFTPSVIAQQLLETNRARVTSESNETMAVWLLTVVTFDRLLATSDLETKMKLYAPILQAIAETLRTRKIQDEQSVADPFSLLTRLGSLEKNQRD